MKRTATDLRAHLYEVLDHVASTGEVVEIQRGNVALQIVRVTGPVAKRKQARTLPNLIVGDPDDLIQMDWEWNKGKDL